MKRRRSVHPYDFGRLIDLFGYEEVGPTLMGHLELTSLVSRS